MLIILTLITILAILSFSAKYPWWLPPKKGILVLMYHHIYDYDSTCDMDKLLYIKPDIFAKQLDILLKNKFTAITLDELSKAYKEKSFVLPKKPVLITFDDGWLNNYTKAFPILKEKNIKANIFLAYNLIGKTNCMTWEQVLEMQSSGLISFGSHTMNHLALNKLSDEKILEELTESKIELEKKLSKPVTSFAYPYGAGAFDKRIRNLVFKSGYTFDFSTKRGITSLEWDKIKPIFRIYIKNGQSLFEFYLQITRGKCSF